MIGSGVGDEYAIQDCLTVLGTSLPEKKRKPSSVGNYKNNVSL
jgi:hypothetical protein